ncbi:MAG: YraN family protein [Eubacteriales bacterium]|nr:YraN family protein [Eubacteriales bacterium]
MNKKHKGNIGEKIASIFLEENGYKIIETNFRCRIGEIDIIAKKGNKLIFTEVKSRTSDQYGLPRESINNKKITTIRKVAAIYLSSKNIDDYDISFDVIEVYCNHIENAF